MDQSIIYFGCDSTQNINWRNYRWCNTEIHEISLTRNFWKSIQSDGFRDKQYRYLTWQAHTICNAFVTESILFFISTVCAFNESLFYQFWYSGTVGLNLCNLMHLTSSSKTNNLIRHIVMISSSATCRGNEFRVKEVRVKEFSLKSTTIYTKHT